MPYGPPHPAQPPDLFLSDTTILRHIDGVQWCWHRRNAYGPGDLFGAPHATPDEAAEHARRTVRVGASYARVLTCSGY